MTPVTTPLTLGDMFDRSFRTLIRILPRAVPVALIMILPPGLLLAAALDMFYTSLGEMLPLLLVSMEPDPSVLQTIGWSVALLCLAAFALLAAMVSVRVAVTALSCGELSGTPLSWQQALGQAIGPRFTRAFAQSVLEYAAYAVLFAAGYLLMMLGAAVQMSVLVLLGVLGLLGSGILAVWWAVRWSLTTAVITREDAGVLESFSRSSSLVAGSWWRVLGVLLLFGILKEFVAGLITTPLSFFALWDFYEAYFSLMATPEAVADPALLAGLFASMGVGIGLVSTAAVLLAGIIVPVYMSVLYFDLRARGGEFISRARPAPVVPAADTTLILDDDAFGRQPI